MKARSDIRCRYPVSKLLQLYTVREFARRLSESGSEVVMNIVNPGLCKTDLSRNAGPLLQILFAAIKALIARTAEMGSRTLLQATFTSPESYGKYLSACQIQKWVSRALKPLSRQLTKDPVMWCPSGLPVRQVRPCRSEYGIAWLQNWRR